jgi:SAM-dependent methyltransferase
MGFFTLELIRLVGPRGRVIAADVERRMIRVLERRARKAGLLEHDARVVQPTLMALDGVRGRIDFGFAFAVVHEMPAPASFFAEVASALKPHASVLLAEPAGHVDDAQFTAEVAAAAQAGLAVESRPLACGRRAAPKARRVSRAAARPTAPPRRRTRAVAHGRIAGSRNTPAYSLE